MNYYGSNNFIANITCQNCHLPEILNGPVAGNVTEAIFCTNVFTGKLRSISGHLDLALKRRSLQRMGSNQLPFHDRRSGARRIRDGHLLLAFSSHRGDSAANVGGGAEDRQHHLCCESFFRSLLEYVRQRSGHSRRDHNRLRIHPLELVHERGRRYIYDIGSGNNATPGGGFAGGSVPIDPVVKPSTLRANNWDAFNGSCQNNATEIPNTIPNWPNPTPNGTWPASFFLTTRPNWWPTSQAFPAVGCDVSSGNVGQIGGTINTVGKQSGLPGIIGQTYAGNTVSAAWGSHVNAIPAEACFLALGGLPDGTNAALNFDQSDCPSSAASGGPTLNGAFKATGTWN